MSATKFESNQIDGANENPVEPPQHTKAITAFNAAMSAHKRQDSFQSAEVEQSENESESKKH